MNICSCLLALVLGWNAAAEIIHEIVEVKTLVSLRCPHSVEGIVTWSRESNGRKVDILTVVDDTDIRHIRDPDKRYSSSADKSLYIRRVTVSDSGRYFCNSEAVELTVIPPGTTRLHATEGTRVILTCPPDVGGSDVKKWSSRNIDDIKHQRGFYVAPVDQTLTITYVKLEHSGLYYCDGKPAAYLNVTKDQTTTSPTTTTPKTRPTSIPSTTPLTNEDTTTRRKGNNTTTSSTPTTTTRQTTAATTTQTEPSTKPLTNEDTTSTTKKRKKKDGKKKNKANNTTTSSTPTTTTRQTVPSTTPLTNEDTTSTTTTPPLWQMCVRTVLGVLYLVIMIGITVTTWRKARQIETENDL